MATRAQIKANANNAKKSTGPRTKGGKSRAAKNALKHGLLARDTVLPGEDPAYFDSQLTALEADIQPTNSLEFELVRQIADAQWRMRRLTRLETGFLAAAVDDTRRHAEKHRPDTLRPGYDGETLLLGSAMLDRTQAFVHLARYDGHLSRRFFRAVKHLADLRRDERKAREARPSADPDPYPGRYVPAQAPPPIDPPGPTAGPIGFRAGGDPAPPASPPKMGGQSRVREGADPLADVSVKKTGTVPSAVRGRGFLSMTYGRRGGLSQGFFTDPDAGGSLSCNASFYRRRGGDKHDGKSLVAHASRRAASPFLATSSPTAAPSRCRPNAHQQQTTKRTQFRGTPAETITFHPGRQGSREYAQVLFVAGAAPSATRNLSWRTPPGVLRRHVSSLLAR